MTIPTHNDNLKRLEELRTHLHGNLAMLQHAISDALDKGLEVGRPYMAVMTNVIYIEAEMRAVHYQLFGTGYSIEQPACKLVCACPTS